MKSWTEVDDENNFVEHYSKEGQHGPVMSGGMAQEKNGLPELSNTQVCRATSDHKYGCPMTISVNSGLSGLWSC